MQIKNGLVTGTLRILNKLIAKDIEAETITASTFNGTLNGSATSIAWSGITDAPEFLTKELGDALNISNGQPYNRNSDGSILPIYANIVLSETTVELKDANEDTKNYYHYLGESTYAVPGCIYGGGTGNNTIYEGDIYYNNDTVDSTPGYYKILQTILGSDMDDGTVLPPEPSGDDRLEYLGETYTVNVCESSDSLEYRINNHAHDDYALKKYYGDTTIDVGRASRSTVGSYSVAEGYKTIASSTASHSEGYGTTASNAYAHSEGSFTKASGYYSHAEGLNTRATNSASHAEGTGTTASGIYGSHSEGYYTKASSTSSHAEGYYTVASGGCSHSEGNKTTASGQYSHAEGINNKATSVASHAEGHATTASNYASHSSGKYSKAMTTGATVSTQNGDVLVIGNGTASTATSNAFRVTYTGMTYGLSAFNSSGADYAEFIKPWYDDNENNEDRIGYFVTIKDDKLYKANENDYIAGITSGNPSVVGNADEDYYWRYERDEFNRIVMEDVPEMVEKTYDEDVYEEVEIESIDENGEKVTTVEKVLVHSKGDAVYNEETHEPIMIETGNMIPNARMKLNADYDSSKQNGYIERKDRKEWDYVGMLGVLPVRDDGTCEVGKYCKCGSDGVATLAENDDNGRFIYMVIERKADNVVSVILK